MCRVLRQGFISKTQPWGDWNHSGSLLPFSYAGLNPKQVQNLRAGTVEEQVSEMRSVPGHKPVFPVGPHQKWPALHCCQAALQSRRHHGARVPLGAIIGWEHFPWRACTAWGRVLSIFVLLLWKSTGAFCWAQHCADWISIKSCS